MLKDEIINALIFQQRLLFAHSNNHRRNSGTKISAVTWPIVHDHIVADASRSKKSLSELLVHYLILLSLCLCRLVPASINTGCSLKKN